MQVIERVRAYLEREWWVIPLHPGTKRPINMAWSTTRPPLREVIAAFEGVHPAPNIGVVWEDLKVDVDLDCREAVVLAPYFLPPTEAIWGHQAKPKSHWLYLLSSPLSKAQYRVRKDPTDNRVIVETRTNRNQSMVPGSIHENGHPVEWARPGRWEPSTVDPDVIARAVDLLHAAALIARHWGDPGSGRHDLCLALAGGLCRLGWSLEEAQEFIRPILMAAGDNETEDRMRTVEDTFENTAIRETTGWPTLMQRLPPGVGLEVRRRLGGEESTLASNTDLGNALRLERWFGEDIRFCPELERWFIWNGRFWERDSKISHRILGFAQKVTDKILTEELPQASDDDVAKAIRKHAISSQSVGRTKAMIEQAKGLPNLLVAFRDLDADPKLLNCRNGTLNLDTMALQPHDPDDYHTMITPCSYLPGARSDTWERFLRDCTGGDEEKLKFLQKCAGYSLQGGNPSEKLFMIFGPAKTGKSTFIRGIQGALGEYAKNTDPSTFATPRDGSGPGAVREDLVRLRGARMVFTGEVEEGARWGTAVIKRLTGGDLITARSLYSSSVEFEASFKIWIGTNVKPVVRDSSGGFWRRVILVPFENQVASDQTDIHLKESLARPESQAAILSWCLTGYKLWQEEDLEALPESVQEEVQAYRQESDALSEFLAEMCVMSPLGQVEAGRLYTTYVGWARAQGAQPISQPAFKTSMTVRDGFGRVRGERGFRYTGLELRVNAEQIYSSLVSAGAGSSDPFAPRGNQN